jgi:nucleolar protein 4
VILPNSPAAETIPQVELEKRTSSFNARRTMLRSNPSLYVSKTRLSIRQIPLFVTERVLKRLATHSVREFNAEVKKDVREGLSPDELAEPAEIDDQDSKDVIKAEHDTKSKKRKPVGVRPTSVKQAKIVRQADRVDPVTGKGRSRGYGFIEMHTHADALRVLRWANNNADVGVLFDKWWKEELADLMKQEKTNKITDEARMKRMKDEMEGTSKPAKGTLIVEFSIENIQVVQRRAALKEKVVSHHRLSVGAELHITFYSPNHMMLGSLVQVVRKSHRPRNVAYQPTKPSLSRPCGSRKSHRKPGRPLDL